MKSIFGSYGFDDHNSASPRSGRRFALLAVFTASLLPCLQNGWARDIRLTLPRHSELTPVQRLNREGVEDVRRHQYEKAEAVFYKAYLYDAADPFTLNNLGYLYELQGNLERAKKFYTLASEQDCTARIDLSSAKHLEGKPMTAALNSIEDVPMRVNRMNVEAIELLQQNRNFEAVRLLQQALTLDSGNVFTLNNLGVAEEATGDFESAVEHYDAAAQAHSSEPVVITLQRSWRGKPVSQMASQSARALRKRMRDMGDQQTRAAMFALQGVSALNRNDWPAAKQYFLHAYSADPTSAFSLNNLGYIAEKEGDMETAQFYYSQARKASDAGARVGLATEPAAEGRRLVTVASRSGLSVDSELTEYSQAARQQTGPVELIRRGAAAEPSTPATQPPAPSQDTGSKPLE